LNFKLQHMLYIFCRNDIDISHLLFFVTVYLKIMNRLGFCLDSLRKKIYFSKSVYFTIKINFDEIFTFLFNGAAYSGFCSDS
jgi:hypothetical protein